MIKPDVMDGVPEEEGWYYFRIENELDRECHNWPNGFVLCLVVEDDETDHLLCRPFFHPQGPNIVDIDFASYEWSRKLEDLDKDITYMDENYDLIKGSSETPLGKRVNLSRTD